MAFVIIWDVEDVLASACMYNDGQVPRYKGMVRDEQTGQLRSLDDREEDGEDYTFMRVLPLSVGRLCTTVTRASLTSYAVGVECLPGTELVAKPAEA